MDKKFLIFCSIFFRQIQSIYTFYLNEGISDLSQNNSYNSSFKSLEEFYSKSENMMTTAEDEILIFQSDVHCNQQFENKTRMTFE